MILKRINTKRVGPRVGDIFEIPLPDGRFAYGRVFRDAAVGIYRNIFNCAQTPPIESSFAFTVGLYDDILKSGRWRIVGHEPFESEEAEWPPPSFIKDVISGEYSLYHKGVIRPSTEHECKGLEETAVWDEHHVTDRIIGIQDFRH